eukprot:6193202-Pleurochrysis_carterae.AAC.2
MVQSSKPAAANKDLGQTPHARGYVHQAGAHAAAKVRPRRSATARVKRCVPKHAFRKLRAKGSCKRCAQTHACKRDACTNVCRMERTRTRAPPRIRMWARTNASAIAGVRARARSAQRFAQGSAQGCAQGRVSKSARGARVCARVRASVRTGARKCARKCARISAQECARMCARKCSCIMRARKCARHVRAQHACLRANVCAQVHTQVCAQVRTHVCKHVCAQVRSQVCAQVRTQVCAQVHTQVRAQVFPHTQKLHFLLYVLLPTNIVYHDYLVCRGACCTHLVHVYMYEYTGHVQPTCTRIQAMYKPCVHRDCNLKTYTA